MNVVFWIFLLITPYVYAGGLFECICGGKTEKTTIIIEHATRAKSIQANRLSLAQQALLPLPRGLSKTKSSSRPTVSPASDRPEISHTDTALMDIRRSLTPRIHSSPSTPATPLDDDSPLSPGSPLTPLHEPPAPPLFQAGRIITYPEDILREQRHARYQQATVFAKAFIDQLPSIREKQHRKAQANEEFEYILAYPIPDNPRYRTIKLTKDRLSQLEPLINSHLTAEQAESIMNIVAVKLDGMQRNLRQDMVNKLPEERDRSEVTREIDEQEDKQKYDLNQIATIIRPHIKPRV